LDRLREFVAGGGRVLFLGHLPTTISGRTYRDARAATAEDFTWAKVSVEEQLGETPTPPAQPPASAPGPLVVPAAIEAALRGVIVASDVMMDGTEPALRVMKRRLKDSDVYLFFNEGAADVSRTVTLHGDGQMVEEWNAATGKVAAVVSRREEEEMSVRLELKGYEAKVLMVR
jgi:hypothetical protein